MSSRRTHVALDSTFIGSHSPFRSMPCSTIRYCRVTLLKETITNSEGCLAGIPCLLAVWLGCHEPSPEE